MLSRKLAKHIKIGRLTLRCDGKTDLVFGFPDPDHPQLDVTIGICDRQTAWKIALNPDLYVGEAYMSGGLTIERGTLRDFLELCFLNFRRAAPGSRSGRLAHLAHWVRRALQQRNTRRRASRNVAHHYDLSDVLYGRFLDKDRQYSCAYFPRDDLTLEQAQEAKKDHILAKLLLKPGQRVLDIGCGWGGLALTMARRGADQVIGVTLSKEQLSVARNRAATARLEQRVKFEMQDYRDVSGPFDRIVSVGMFEHVGTPHYQEFFDTWARLLTDDGVALLHSIGRLDEPGCSSAWIRKYIFPGGYAPALSEVMRAIERSGLMVTDVEVLRLHYAKTLREWALRFAESRAAVAAQYDETFCRMWEFYLAACEMGFRYDGLVVFQIQLTKRVDAVPITRDYMMEGAMPQKSPLSAAKAA